MDKMSSKLHPSETQMIKYTSRRRTHTEAMEGTLRHEQLLNVIATHIRTIDPYNDSYNDLTVLTELYVNNSEERKCIQLLRIFICIYIMYIM